MDKPWESVLRSRFHSPRPIAASPFSVGPVLMPSAARSRIWSPIATPPRGDSLAPLRLKMPNGRFWIGKSQPGSFADSTQLFSPASCVASKTIPDLVVVPLQLARAHRKPGRPPDVARLPHESERVLDLVRLQLGVGRALESREIRAVRRHAVVYRDAPGREAFGLGVVHAVHQAHQFAHHVAVEPRRPERIFGDLPARREDDE